METLEQIKEMTELLSVDTTKFFKGNKSAGTRARKTAQDLKALLQKLRGEILEHKTTRSRSNWNQKQFNTQQPHAVDDTHTVTTVCVRDHDNSLALASTSMSKSATPYVFGVVVI